MRIVQLSDLHLQPPPGLLYGRVDTAACLTAALERITTLAPDLVLLSGDLADRGSAVEYAWLARALASLPCPVALMPGNHDRRAALRTAFPEQHWGGDIDAPCHRRLDTPEGALLLLDTLVPGEEYGRVDAAALAWLESACPTTGRALLVMHHLPFAIGIPGMDAIACRGEAALAAWLARHDNVEALLCGHVHRFVSTVFAGRPAITAPSPAHQIALALEGTPGDLAFTLEPGGFLLHLWRAGQPLVTHYVPNTPAPTYRYADLGG